METKTGHKIDAVRVIYNDDIKVIDFLAELKNRKILKDLDNFIVEAKQESACLLYNCKPDKIVVLILYKAPLGLNEEQNNLMLYISNEVIELFGYFHNWAQRIISEKTVVLDAVVDILDLLSYHLVKEQDKNTSLNHMG